MAEIYALLIGAAGAVFALVQFPNLLRRSVRVKVSVACVLAAAGGVVPATFRDDWETAMTGALVWAISGIGLTGKWFYEVQEDVTAREERGLSPLLPSRGVSVALRSMFSGVYQWRYRSRMFRDPWSRRYLIGLSQPLPRSLMDDLTIAELRLAYAEQDKDEETDTTEEQGS